MNNLELARRGLKRVIHEKGKAERDKVVRTAWEKAFDELTLAEQITVTMAAKKLAGEVNKLGVQGAMEVVMMVGAAMDERDYTG